MVGNWLYRYQVTAWEVVPYIVNWNSEAVSGGGHIDRHRRMFSGELTQGPQHSAPTIHPVLLHRLKFKIASAVSFPLASAPSTVAYSFPLYKASPAKKI
jgi:hypothetical protein